MFTNNQVVKSNLALQEYLSSLYESTDRFQTLAASNPLLIWMTDEKGGNHYINQTYRDDLGVSFEAVRGLYWLHYLHPDDTAGYSNAFQQATREQPGQGTATLAVVPVSTSGK